ncbi:MAG: hypothetical protein CMJ64_25110 [Planctomycetaceae bacterium]|nr:hypothetical protein [Planctomycetaceae bacterium]
MANAKTPAAGHTTRPLKAFVSRLVFVLSVSVFVAGVGLGVYESWSEERRLPPIYIDYTDEIEELSQSTDYERTIEELWLAAKLDHFAHRPRHFFDLCRTGFRANDRKTMREGLEGLRLLMETGGSADSRIHFYLSVAISLQPDANKDDLFEALGYADQATQEQPDFAPAHVQLGQLFAILAVGENKQVDVVELQRAALCCETALAIDPSNTDAARTLSEIQQILRSLPSSDRP